jgi:hypothetical protein
MTDVILAFTRTTFVLPMGACVMVMTVLVEVVRSIRVLMMEMATSVAMVPGVF